MQRFCQFIWMLSLSAFVWPASAAQVQIATVNYSSQAANRVGFELSAAGHQRYFVLNNPSRLVVDFNDTVVRQALNSPPADHPLFANVRTAVRNGKDLRVVFELKTDVEVKGVMLNNTGLVQLQLDLTPKVKPLAGPEKPVAPIAEAKAEKAMLAASKQSLKETVAVSQPKTVALKPVKAKGRNIVVAIDAGHGGKDVGAQGGNGTQEKDVVFAIAKRLESLVNNQPGMHAMMIRKGDYFVKLNERVRLAREAKADLFVSIHADAFNDPSAHGASVYTLANKGASSQGARWLADSENAADLLGGAGSDDRDDTLASVLHDLTRTAAKEASLNIGSTVLKSVKSVGHLHRSSVQRAGFVVLKSPDIPSILVETAFISNPQEERNLNSNAYQERMASAVFGGIMSHFRQYAPANTLLAQLNRTGKTPRLAAAIREDNPLNGKNKLLLAGKAEAVSAKTSRNSNRGEILADNQQANGPFKKALHNLEEGSLKVRRVL